MNVTAVSKNDTSVTGNSTSAISYEWEYYYDYLDPVIVDESKLKYNKCKFLNITFFFFILLLTSQKSYPPFQIQLS